MFQNKNFVENRKIFSFALFFFIGMMVHIDGASAKNLVWDEFAPVQYDEKVEASLKGKKADLYSCTKAHAIEFELKGPRKILIHIRNVFQTQHEEMKAYRINVLLDGRNFDEYSFRSAPTNLATILGDNISSRKLGMLRKIVLEIPEGVHRLKFFPSHEEEPLLLRCFASEIFSQGEKHVAMSPEKYAQVVGMIFQEKEMTYYRMTPEKPIQLTVVGPTEIKVVTRLEFNQRMKGKFSYQIQVFEDDRLVQTRQYRTYKSDVVSYQKVTNVTAGRSRSFLIPVRKGKHVYRFVPVTSQKETVIAKILIPRKDVGVTEK